MVMVFLAQQTFFSGYSGRADYGDQLTVPRAFLHPFCGRASAASGCRTRMKGFDRRIAKNAR
jgi:hypothetical protein